MTSNPPLPLAPSSPAREPPLPSSSLLPPACHPPASLFKLRGKSSEQSPEENVFPLPLHPHRPLSILSPPVAYSTLPSSNQPAGQPHQTATKLISNNLLNQNPFEQSLLAPFPPRSCSQSLICLRTIQQTHSRLRAGFA